MQVSKALWVRVSAAAIAVGVSAVASAQTKPAPADTHQTASADASQHGLAAVYSDRLNGHRTASGERYNRDALTAANPSYAFGTKVKVTNARSGKSVVVRINDRGPFIRGRVLDLSKAAAQNIGMVRSGHAKVCYEIIG